MARYYFFLILVFDIIAVFWHNIIILDINVVKYATDSSTI